MAKSNSTRSTITTGLDPATTAEFNEMALRLNKFGTLLAGVEDICDAEEIGSNAKTVAAAICRQINHSVCEMADRLDAIAKEGGAA